MTDVPSMRPQPGDDLVDMPFQAARPVRERMVRHFPMAEDDLGLRAGEGLGIGPGDVSHLEPPAGWHLSDADRERMSGLGRKGSRAVNGMRMTRRVPDERVRAEP